MKSMFITTINLTTNSSYQFRASITAPDSSDSQRGLFICTDSLDDDCICAGRGYGLGGVCVFVLYLS